MVKSCDGRDESTPHQAVASREPSVVVPVERISRDILNSVIARPRIDDYLIVTARIQRPLLNTTCTTTGSVATPSSV